MAFFKDIWQGATNPDEPNEFMTQFAQQLMMGGGSKGPLARLGNKLIGGLLHGGQKRGAKRQKESRAEEMAGIFGPMFATGPGDLLKAGAPQLLQGGAKGVLSPEGLAPLAGTSKVDPRTGIALPQPTAVASGGPAAEAAAAAAMTPEAFAAVTKGSSSLPGITEAQKAAGQFGVKMAMSENPEMKAFGMSVIQGAMQTPERFKTVGNNMFDTVTQTYLVPPEASFDIKLGAGETAIHSVWDPKSGKYVEKVYTGPPKREKPTVVRDIKDPVTGVPSAYLLDPDAEGGLGKRLGAEAENISTVNTNDITRGTKTDLQRSLILAEESLAKLDEIDSTTKRQYLTGSGKVGLWAKDKFNTFVSAVSGKPSVFEKELVNFEDWNTMSMAYVNDTIKNYTGVAMPQTEAPRLLAGMPDPGDSPAAHAGAMRAARRMAKLSVKLTRQYLNEGLPLEEAKSKTASKLSVAVTGFENKNYGAANRALDRFEGDGESEGGGKKFNFTETTE